MKQEDDFNNQVTGYTQRNETSETVSQNVFSPFSCIQGSKCISQNWFYSVLDHLVNNQNQALNCFGSSLQSHLVWVMSPMSMRNSN